jgi:hypothetical protein
MKSTITIKFFTILSLFVGVFLGINFIFFSNGVTAASAIALSNEDLEYVAWSYNCNTIENAKETVFAECKKKGVTDCFIHSTHIGPGWSAIVKNITWRGNHKTIHFCFATGRDSKDDAIRDAYAGEGCQGSGEVVGSFYDSKTASFD